MVYNSVFFISGLRYRNSRHNCGVICCMISLLCNLYVCEFLHVYFKSVLPIRTGPCMYIYILTFMATITNIWYLQVNLASFLPEAIRRCLHTCNVYGVLLTLSCTYIPTLTVTTANIV